MFRSEAREAYKDNLIGDVHLSLPTSWHVIGAGFALALVGAALLLCFGSYARVETVSGQIRPDRGSAVIMPSRAGVIVRVQASDGDHVAAGAPLITIRAEEVDRAGSSGQERVLAALTEQDGRLSSQEASILMGATEIRQRLDTQAAGLRAEITSLDKQLAMEENLVAAAQSDFSRAQAIAQKGFLSARDLQVREEIVLSRRQQQAALEQARVAKVAALSETPRAAREALSQARAAAAGVAGDRAVIAQRRYDVEASRGYTLGSPITGTVTAITARLGQPAQVGASLMTVIPDGARLQAELYVPTGASGFLAPGQEVRLQIDAFPYARFGTVQAVVTKISSAAVNVTMGTSSPTPSYLVTASILDPRIYGFGRYHALQPDMTLTARIVTEKRSLLEWLFEPVLAVRRR